ncbi:MAG: hypothetical protein R2769_02915 [Saprospiraceae bacterium]
MRQAVAEKTRKQAQADEAIVYLEKALNIYERLPIAMSTWALCTASKESWKRRKFL